jgi:6-pyruvoyltetrahydropterin/6-carboxytetrahydropterin synthase
MSLYVINKFIELHLFNSNQLKMEFIRVTKIFNFEMAHLLQHHDGLCRNIHGHSYSLHISVGGKPLNNSGDPKDGMVWDFSDMKKLIHIRILDKFDHSLVINGDLDEKIFKKLEPMKFKIVSLPFEPTSENLVSHFANSILKHIPLNVKLISVKLFETSTSYAEWLAEDNMVES